MKSPASPPAQSGFSLIEVLVALLIASVALAAFLRVTVQAVAQVDYLERKSLALLAAHQVLSSWEAGLHPLREGMRTEPCPQGGLRLVCRSRVQARGPGLMAVSVDVAEFDDPDFLLARARSQFPVEEGP